LVGSFYDGVGSIFVEAYDAFHGSGQPPLTGDADFYERLARAAGGPVLELGCGTGRVALPLAAAGLDVTGVDSADAMLAVARRKLWAAPAAVRERLTLLNGDMTELDLGQRFGFVFVAFRSFQQLLTIALQRKVLEVIRRHLQPAGRMALHLYDPRLDVLIGDGGAGPVLAGTHPVTGRHYAADVLRCRFDHVAQVRHDLWRYTEHDRSGAVLDAATRELAVRWTYRWELRHLLELCGFTVTAEYSDFLGAPPAYGKELIVVAAVG
jgi:SAM-dependent methyltransferase